MNHPTTQTTIGAMSPEELLGFTALTVMSAIAILVMWFIWMFKFSRSGGSQKI